MKRVIFVRNTRSRKPEFQIQTTAFKDNNGVVFRKSALTPAADRHIGNLQDTYELLKKHGLNGHFAAIINHRNHAKTFLDFETLTGSNLERLFVYAVIANDNMRIAELLDLYLTFLDSLTLPKAKNHRHNYDTAILGANLYKQFAGSDCIFPGLLDLYFDNLVLKDSEIRAFDYEWSYAWCLPKNYVFSRSLMWFGIRHAELFRLHSRRVDFVTIREGIVLPRYILELYPGIEQSINKAYVIEINHFQPYVTNTRQSPGKQYVNPKRVSEKVLFALDNAELREQRIKVLNAEITRLSNELNVANADKAQLAQEIVNITNSKRYRVGSSLAKIKHNSPWRNK